MFVFLSKVLAIPLTPVGLTLTFLVLGFVFAFVYHRHNRALACFICGALSLLFFSLPLTSHLLMRGLESQYPPTPVYEQASAVVFLGGATKTRQPPRIYVETNINADRVFHAVRVFRQTFSPKLVLTGGRISFLSVDTLPEAYCMFELLNELFGIDTADVILEFESRNTRENAVYTKMALEEAGYGSDIILVTNAYHMPRAVGIFKKAGFERVIPAPTGYFEEERYVWKPLRQIPNAGSLHVSTMALNEYVGIIVYTLMGWI